MPTAVTCAAPGHLHLSQCCAFFLPALWSPQPSPMCLCHPPPCSILLPPYPVPAGDQAVSDRSGEQGAVRCAIPGACRQAYLVQRAVLGQVLWLSTCVSPGCQDIPMGAVPAEPKPQPEALDTSGDAVFSVLVGCLWLQSSTREPAAWEELLVGSSWCAGFKSDSA